MLPAPIEPIDLVDIVDFKWLLSAQGHHVHIERLQRDPAYARQCLTWASQSPHRTVREAALRIGERLGLAPEALKERRAAPE